MGKQSARLIYRGKDHKDIFFQGHYHDAMYIGSELVWYKIRQEGYYVFFVSNGKEGRYHEGLYIIVYDEKTQDFEIVMEIIYAPDPFSESYFGGLTLVYRDGILLDGISPDDAAWHSVDGIHFEKTNLTLNDQNDAIPFLFRYYHGYSIKGENGFSEKVNYVWLMTNGLPSLNRYYVRKATITKNGNDYDIEVKKALDTGLDLRSSFSTEDRTGSMYIPSNGDSRFALHVEQYRWKIGSSIIPEALRDEYTRTTIKYYDTEKEESGEIAEFEYKSGEYQGPSHNINPYGFYHVNGVYVFFIADFKSVFQVETSQELYAYYSYDGITYNNSIIYSKKKPLSDRVSEYPRVMLVLHRKGMYYLYAGGEKDEYYEPPYTVYLTTDFNHFQKKQIPREITIGGKTINTMKLINAEADMMNNERRYFYDGEVCEPESGICTIYGGNLIYIDNMFFRESNGNKIFNYLED